VGDGRIKGDLVAAASDHSGDRLDAHLVRLASSLPQANKGMWDSGIEGPASRRICERFKVASNSMTRPFGSICSNVMRTEPPLVSRCTLTTIVCVCGSLSVLGHNTGGQGSGVAVVTKPAAMGTEEPKH
jgi:hypothetical protein